MIARKFLADPQSRQRIGSSRRKREGSSKQKRGGVTYLQGCDWSFAGCFGGGENHKGSLKPVLILCRKIACYSTGAAKESEKLSSASKPWKR